MGGGNFAYAQTGQSDDTHSPEEWASMVVSRTKPAIAVNRCGLHGRDFKLPNVLRTISRPLERDTSEGVVSSWERRSYAGDQRIFGVGQFRLGFGECARYAAVNSLECCMAELLVNHFEADRPCPRPLS